MSSDIEDHSVGATVRHTSPFEHLVVPNRRENPDRPFIDHWIKPFYLGSPAKPAFREALDQRRADVGPVVAEELLSYFDWRPKIVGARFATIFGRRVERLRR